MTPMLEALIKAAQETGFVIASDEDLFQAGLEAGVDHQDLMEATMTPEELSRIKAQQAWQRRVEEPKF